MKLAIMQPYFFPYIGYFQLISAVDRFVVYDDVNYINRGWINRNNILVNNQACMIQVPLKEASQNRLINEINIVNDPKWKTKLMKTIEMAYKKAPYFLPVFEILESILSSQETNISVLNTLALKKVCDYLKIYTEIIPHSSIYENKHLKGPYRILDICLKNGANHYINPSGGQELYDRSFFEQSGVKINFIHTTPHSYQQWGKGFVSHLSIIDVMMFNSVEETQHIIKENCEFK